MYCYGYTFCDLAITQCGELLISCCTAYIIHIMMWSLFTSCDHNSCCVIIVHSFWSPDVTKQGWAFARCRTILSYPWFRNCSPIRGNASDIRYQKWWHWGEREKRETNTDPWPVLVVYESGDNTTFSNINYIVCLSVCLYVYYVKIVKFLFMYHIVYL